MFSAKRCLLGRVGGQECSVLVGLIEVERRHLREVVVWEGSAWRSPWSRGMDTWRFGWQTQVLKDLADLRRVLWIFRFFAEVTGRRNLLISIWKLDHKHQRFIRAPTKTTSSWGLALSELLIERDLPKWEPDDAHLAIQDRWTRLYDSEPAAVTRCKIVRQACR